MILVKGISVLLGSLLIAVAAAAGSLSEEQLAAARALLDRNGIEADIAIDQYMSFGNGGGMVSGLQVHSGYPVFDNRLTFHFGPGGTVVRMPDGSMYQMSPSKELGELEFDEALLIDEDTAIAAVVSSGPDAVPEGVDTDVLRSVRTCADKADRINATLGVLAQEPVWQVRCRYSRSPGIFVHAQTRELMTFDPDVIPSSLPSPMPEPVRN